MRFRDSTRLGAAVFAAALLAGCARTEAPPPEPVRPVKTIVVGGLGTGEFSFPGMVEASEKAVLSFRVRGRLTQLPVEEGQEVAAGDLIGRLDPRDYEIAVTQAEAEFTKAEADFDRYKRLYENDAVPLADFQARRATRDVRNAQLDEARRNLSFTRLTAPFTGRIGQRYVENHMDVQANQEIVDLNDVRRVEILIDVAESVIRGLRSDRIPVKAFAEFDNAPGRRFPLEFKEAANRADPSTQTFRVRFTMAQPGDFALLPGMTAQVRVEVEPGSASGPDQSALTLPAFAVAGAEDNSPFVWVLGKDMTVHRQPITIGPLQGTENVLVRSGLAGGEEIVVAGLRSLTEGMTVSRWKPE